jgi:tetratricopeptide (TPR) repeat protein
LLPLLIGLLVAAGPLLNGSWDLWAQSLIALSLVFGTAAWLCGRLLIGYVPLPSNRTLAWAVSLAALAWVSAVSSPLAAYTVPAWRAVAASLWIFPALAVVSKDKRGAIDQAVRAASWALVLLAVYQRLQFGVERPYASLLNQNVFAGTILMLLPLAAQRRDWLLSATLVLCLWWTRSVGAWLGLAAALVLTRRAGPAGVWSGAAVGFICLVALYAKLQTPEVNDRLRWWASAWEMIKARPLLGFGPGSYAYALPAHQSPGLGSLFAHQHILELAAELGLPFALAWLAAVARWLRHGGPHKRFGAVAILVQSLWDYALSIPANLWLFSYLTASSIPETSRGVNVPARWKLPACAAALLLAAAGGFAVERHWRADRLRAAASELLYEGSRDGRLVPRPVLEAETARKALELLESSAEIADHPETARLSAEVELLLGRDQGRLLAAAGHLERAAALNPYRPSTYGALENLYRRLERPDLAEDAVRRCGALCRR